MSFLQKNGYTDWDTYFDYIEAKRAVLPEALYQFACLVDHYTLSHPNSLHDSWLESLTVREPSEPGKRSDRKIEVELVLLGQMHDRMIGLTYSDVGAYGFENPPEDPSWHWRGHGDLLEHQFTCVGKGLFEHEMHFRRGSVFKIQFKGFQHRIDLIVKPETKTEDQLSEDTGS